MKTAYVLVDCETCGVSAEMELVEGTPEDVWLESADSLPDGWVEQGDEYFCSKNCLRKFNAWRNGRG